MKNNRKTAILKAAMDVAQTAGYSRVTLQEVARQARCTHGLVLYYFSTVAQLRRAVMSEAIRVGDAAIIAQGLAIGDSKAKRAPPELKAAAAAYLMEA
jgi:AcrR family transcriptional regulator